MSSPDSISNHSTPEHATHLGAAGELPTQKSGLLAKRSFVSFHNASIKTKLILMLVLACGVSVALCCSAFVTNDVFMMKSDTESHLSVLAQVLGANSLTALLFDDSEVAGEVLASLQQEPSITFACLYNAQHDVFASYRAPAADSLTAPTHHDGKTVWLQDGSLGVYRPILYDGRVVGTLYLQASMEEFYARLRNYGLIVVGVLVVSLGLSLFLSSRLQSIISAPILRLAELTKRISSDGDFSVRAQKEGADEIGTLSDGFNEMLVQIQNRDAQLHEMHQQLLQTARTAGMAEVATGILHNVGNTLNSVNISAAELARKLRGSEIGNLAIAAELLNVDREDLAEFLTSDPKGRHLPSYLIKASKHLKDEHVGMLDDVERLAEHVEHIKTVIRQQQKYAGVSQCCQPESPAELMEDALKLCSDVIRKHQVHVDSQCCGVTSFTVDRAQVLQILVNLVRNAVDAVSGLPEGDRRVSVRIEPQADDRVRIEISDNGVGIGQENMPRIFNYGFTTKKDGHGFGLHTCANAAQAMGGSLTARSAGPGCGSTFTLQVPSTPQTKAVAT